MAARRDGSAIKMNHVSANRSQRTRCVVTAFSYATLRAAVVKTHKSRLDVYAPIGRKTSGESAFLLICPNRLLRC